MWQAPWDTNGDWPHCCLPFTTTFRVDRASPEMALTQCYSSHSHWISVMCLVCLTSKIMLLPETHGYPVLSSWLLLHHMATVSCGLCQLKITWDIQQNNFQVVLNQHQATGEVAGSINCNLPFTTQHTFLLSRAILSLHEERGRAL